ncbi:MAG: 50S ribosomal protein L25 [Candidatus Hatepunaea meridiana]|nr:50S ribosomal protein L25 [Candidatus Hatepunaea meridiana]
MNDNTLNATPRKCGNKGMARQIRFQDRVPGIFYYRNDINIPFSVDSVELSKLIRQKYSLINLSIEGYETRECVFRNIQRDPVYDGILHVDLMGIKRGQKLTVTVPVKLTGIPEGVKTGGGILQSNMNEFEIECLPKDIPREIEIDVSDLDIGHSRFIRDLEFPELKLLYDPGEVIATVVPPTIIKEVTEITEEEEEVEEGTETKTEETPEKN